MQTATIQAAYAAYQALVTQHDNPDAQQAAARCLRAAVLGYEGDGLTDDLAYVLDSQPGDYLLLFENAVHGRCLGFDYAVEIDENGFSVTRVGQSPDAVILVFSGPDADYWSRDLLRALNGKNFTTTRDSIDSFCEALFANPVLASQAA